MLDEWMRPWLIEVNTNPCLDLSAPILARLIPYMVENALRMGLDSVFPPPENFSNNDKYSIPENALHYNKFDLRTYMLVTYRNGVTKGYWYQEGYVRTASYMFSLG